MRTKPWPPELVKISARADMAKKEWDELIRTGKKTSSTRRDLSAKWEVDYSVLCRRLRESNPPNYAQQATVTRILHGGTPQSPRTPAPGTATWPGPQVLSHLSGASDFIPQGQGRSFIPTPTSILQLWELINLHRPRSIPSNSAMLRLKVRHLESDRYGLTAVPGDKSALLSSSEEDAICQWFQFRLEVADLVTVYDLVDAANSVILISSKGKPVDEGRGAGRVQLSTVRYATARWSREFLTLRPELFWSSIKPRVYDVKERPDPDTHCFIAWFYGPHGPEKSELQPKPHLSQPVPAGDSTVGQGPHSGSNIV